MKMITALRRICVGCSLAVAVAARAQTPAPQQPPPPQPVGSRLHDIFYLRVSLGLGFGQGSYASTAAGSVPEQYKFVGLGALFDVMVGGSPTPGVVLGGAFVDHTLFAPKVKANGAAVDTSRDKYAYAMRTFGLFFGIYPNPKIGLNVHGLVGYSTLSVQVDDFTGDTGTHRAFIDGRCGL